LIVPPNQQHSPVCPVPLERGASRSSRTLGAGCGGRGSGAGRATLPPSLKLRRTGTKPSSDLSGGWLRTAKSCGPDAPMLASSFRGAISAKATVAKEPGHRGEHEGNRKTIAQGRPGFSGEPVVTNSCALSIRTRGYGCGGHPAFPAPSVFSRATFNA
jgi:hypothetical protein